MIRLTTVIAISLVSVLPVQAQESAVVEGLPAGTLVFDLGPTLEAAGQVQSPTVVEPATLTPSATETVQAPASTRSVATMPLVLPAVETGTVLDPAIASGQIDLAPGETVLQVIAAPSIVKVPAVQPSYGLLAAVPAPDAEVRTAPEPKIDPVTGRLRDTAGWTGRSDGPASIGCFPAGACAVLNQR